MMVLVFSVTEIIDSMQYEHASLDTALVNFRVMQHVDNTLYSICV